MSFGRGSKSRRGFGQRGQREEEPEVEAKPVKTEKANSWLFQGADVDEAMARDEGAQEARQKSYRPELWLQDGLSCEFILLDEGALGSFYQIYTEGGKGGSYHTVPADGDPNLWEHWKIKHNPVYTEIYEGIRTSPWVDGDGKTREDPMCRFISITSGSVQKRFRILRERHGTLENMKVLIEVNGKKQKKRIEIDFAGHYEGDPLKVNGADLTRFGVDKAIECYAPPDLQTQSEILGVPIPDEFKQD